jgi:hypothetical protein
MLSFRVWIYGLGLGKTKLENNRKKEKKYEDVGLEALKVDGTF